MRTRPLKVSMFIPTIEVMITGGRFGGSLMRALSSVSGGSHLRRWRCALEPPTADFLSFRGVKKTFYCRKTQLRLSGRLPGKGNVSCFFANVLTSLSNIPCMCSCYGCLFYMRT